MSTIKINSTAKDFSLDDQDETEIRLSSLKGKKVLLSFHPLAWTKVCAEQMKDLEKNLARFEELNTVALGKIQSFFRISGRTGKLQNFMGFSGKKMDFPKGQILLLMKMGR